MFHCFFFVVDKKAYSKTLFKKDLLPMARTGCGISIWTRKKTNKYKKQRQKMYRRLQRHTHTYYTYILYVKTCKNRNQEEKISKNRKERNCWKTKHTLHIYRRRVYRAILL